MTPTQARTHASTQPTTSMPPTHPCKHAVHKSTPHTSPTLAQIAHHFSNFFDQYFCTSAPTQNQEHLQTLFSVKKLNYQRKISGILSEDFKIKAACWLEY